MTWRRARTVLAMLGGLLAAAGCASLRFGGLETVSQTHPPEPGKRAPSQLPAPQAAQLCLAAAGALENQGYVAEAIAQYENARLHDPRAKSVSSHLAVLYDMQDDPQRAEAEYERALQEHPGDAELLNDLGYFLLRHDDPKNAEMWLRKAVALDPGCRRAWINLGQAMAKQGRFDESRQAFARVLRPAEVYSNVGVLLAKQGRVSEARMAFQQALALDPKLKQPQAFLSALESPPIALPPRITRAAPRPAPVITRVTPPALEPVIIQTSIPSPPPASTPQPVNPSPQVTITDCQGVPD